MSDFDFDDDDLLRVELEHVREIERRLRHRVSILEDALRIVRDTASRPHLVELAKGLLRDDEAREALGDE